MNEQIAKGLRRRARQTTIGAPMRSLVTSLGSNAINHPHTTRGVYRTLKKAWKKEHRHG